MADKSCKFPWTWRNVKLQNDQWRFCCKTDWKDYDQSLEVLETVRQSFRDQEEDPACIACWKPENAGFKSYRNSMWGETTHEKIVKFYDTKPSIEWIDIEVGDTCNMYCMTCGPGNSTTWQQILKENPNDGNKFEDGLPRLFDLIKDNIKSLNHLNIYGGEPSVDPNFHTFVDKLVELELPKPIGIQIYTNGNYSDNHRVKFERGVEKLKDKGWQVHLNFSLDAVGEDVEFTRGGLIFERFEKNLDTAIKMGFVPNINISTSILNVQNQVDIYYWLKEKGIESKIIPKMNVVSRPFYFNVSILGKELVNFMPQWPEFTDPNWITYKKRLDNHLSLATAGEPDTASITRLINNINRYETIYKGEMPEYYKNFLEQLKKLV